MKTNQLGFFAKNNEGGTSGRSSGNAIQLPPESDTEDNGLDDDDGTSDGPSFGNASTDDVDYFNRIHGLDSKGQRPPSTLGKVIDKAEDDNKEEDGEEDNEEEDDGQKGTSKEDDKKEDGDLTDEELLAIKEEELKNAKGKPVSREVSQTIKNFKKSITNKAKEIEELRKTQLTEETRKELEELRADRAKLVELQKQYEDEHFEKSEAFKQAFVQPIKDVEKVLNSYFKIEADDNASRGALVKLFGEAAAAAQAGDEAKFSEILDEIGEDFVSGGTARKATFGNKMFEWYKLKLEEKKAYEVKDENRKKLVTRKLAEQRKNNATSIDNDIDSHVEEFEVSRKAVLAGMKPEEKADFLKKYREPAEKVKEALGEFAITGKITPELNEIIRKGVIAGAIDYERELGWTAYKSVVNNEKALKDTIAELEGKLAKLSGEPGQRKGSYVKTGDANKGKQGAKPASRIFEALQNIPDYD